MGNEQPSGTSHHFIANSSAEGSQIHNPNKVAWTKSGRIPTSNKQQAKSSWHLARDVSMEILSRKTTKLSIKKVGPTPSLAGSRLTVYKKYHSQPTPALEKSLPVYRIPRMPTEKDIIDITIAHQLRCDFCREPCIGDYLRCRVCIKTFDCQCLFDRGHVTEESLSVPRLRKQDWSCPECSDLLRLLTLDEINYLIQVFDQIDRNKDGYVIMDDFLSFCSTKKMTDSFHLFNRDNMSLERHHFILMDSKQNGLVSWADFALFYACKLIAAKNKTELTSKLTTKELIFARNLFHKDENLKTDRESNLIITKEHFGRVYYDLLLTLKKKYGGHFIDAVLDERQTRDETFEKLTVIGWDAFVREVSIPILLNRLNNDMKNTQFDKTNVISHVNLTSSNDMADDKHIKIVPTMTLADRLSYDETFRKHSKILQKLNQRIQRESIQKKQYGAGVQWSIVESLDEENDLELPKLKPYARDERQTVSEPWSMVKEMQHLRNEPLLITTTHYQMIKV